MVGISFPREVLHPDKYSCNIGQAFANLSVKTKLLSYRQSLRVGEEDSLLTRLRLGLSHLNEHKFKHGFNDTINPICICGGEIESINHFFLYCPEYCEARRTLFDNIKSIDRMLLSQNESSLTHFYTVTLNTTPMLTHSSLTRQLNSYYLQEDSMDRYLSELKLFFSFSNLFFIWLSVFYLFILFCYLLFVLVSQVFVTFYIWFR